MPAAKKATRTRRPEAEAPDAAESLQYPVHRSAGYLIRDIHRGLSQVLDRKINEHGVTIGMWFFLRVLWDEDGLTQRELCRRVRMSEPTAVVALRAMEKRGLIGRLEDTEDRRKVYIVLAPKARRLRAELMPMVKDLNRQLLAGFSPKEVEVLLDMLVRARDNLERMESA